jgi:hypothetical protein
MSNQSDTGESFGSNLLTGAVIVASAFLLYASVAFSQPGEAPASTPATPTAHAIEQVVVIAPHHVS